MAQRFTVRSYRFEFAARGYGPDDVRSVRQTLGLSQPLFADFLGVDISTVRSWEQGSRPPSAIARRFMDEITVNPDYCAEGSASRSPKHRHTVQPRTEGGTRLEGRAITRIATIRDGQVIGSSSQRAIRRRRCVIEIQADDRNCAHATTTAGLPSTSIRGSIPRPGASGADIRPSTRRGAPWAVLTVT